MLGHYWSLSGNSGPYLPERSFHSSGFVEYGSERSGPGCVGFSLGLKTLVRFLVSLEIACGVLGFFEKLAGVLAAALVEIACVFVGYLFR